MAYPSDSITPLPINSVDGHPINVGTTTQTKATDGSTTSWSVIQLLKGIFDKLLGSLAVTGTFWQAIQPVSGTFWQATQPVSLATAPTTPVTGTFWQATQPVSGTVTANVGTVPTLTKGTQGATGYSVQDLKDSGRVLKTYIATAVTGATAEALISLTPYADLVAGGAATTFAVTANKRLRIQKITVTWRNNTAAAGGVTIRFRLLAGTVLVGSPVHATLNATTSLTTIGSGFTATHEFPDGLELSGTMQFGLTQLAVGAVVGLDVQVIGYEY